MAYRDGDQVVLSDGFLIFAPKRGNYKVNLMRKGAPTTVQRQAEVLDHPRQSYSIWKLVQRALTSVMDT